MPTVYIQNLSTGLVLDVKDCNEEQGGEVVMFPYHGKKNQLWKHKDGMFHSKMNKNLVLDVEQATNRVITWSIHGGPNQKWVVGDDGTIASETGVVLDVAAGSTETGARLIAYGKHGGPNQVFKLVKK